MISMANKAHDYLVEVLGERAPSRVKPALKVDEHPLEGEGPVAIFSFELPPAPAAGDADPQHYVVVGETEPNYYPSYSLPPDELYSLHIGTRFMLALGMNVAPNADEPPAAREALRNFIHACNPEVPIDNEQLAALFTAGERYFAVYRVTLRGQEVYCFGADCPAGFSERVDLPPQIPLRLQLGRAIRAEARAAAERESASRSH